MMTSSMRLRAPPSREPNSWWPRNEDWRSRPVRDSLKKYNLESRYTHTHTAGNRVARIRYDEVGDERPSKRTKVQRKDEKLDVDCKIVQDSKSTNERYESVDASERADGKPLLCVANDRGVVRLMTYEKEEDSMSLCSELKMECDSVVRSWQSAIFESKVNPNRLAVVNEEDRVVSLFDITKESRDRDMRTTFWPTSVAWSEKSQCVLVTAQDTLHVFDPRNKSKNGLIHQIRPFRGDNLFTVAQSGNTVMTAGRRGSVYVYDTRKFSLNYRWNAPVKYVLFSIVSLYLLYTHHSKSPHSYITRNLTHHAKPTGIPYSPYWFHLEGISRHTQWERITSSCVAV